MESWDCPFFQVFAYLDELLLDLGIVEEVAHRNLFFVYHGGYSVFKLGFATLVGYKVQVLLHQITIIIIKWSKVINGNQITSNWLLLVLLLPWPCSCPQGRKSSDELSDTNSFPQKWENPSTPSPTSLACSKTMKPTLCIMMRVSSSSK